MQICVLQHVPFEELGNIQGWLEEKGATIRYCRLFAGDRLPAADEFDLFIILGGPMSANDERHYAWLADEKVCIRALVQSGKPVLGICLGAQLIAAAMGSRIYKNYTKEIGWFDIELTDVAVNPFALPTQMRVFHWHGETFELPTGAQLLASSEVCKHQMFLLGERVVGLQCHLETTLENAKSMVLHCADELSGQHGKYIQPAETILSATDKDYQQLEDWMGQILDYITRPAA